MTSSFDSALSPPLSWFSKRGVGLPLALEPQHSGSPPATDGPRCRSPQRRLESCAPRAAAFRAPSLTGPRGACQAAVGQRGTPETHRGARREAKRSGESARAEETVVARNSEAGERGPRGAADSDVAAPGGVRPARTHARVHRPTPATHGHTRPAPPLRRFPPTKPSYNRPGGSRSASAPRAFWRVVLV